jgi:F-type H+-transporting ATPase subunit a
MLEISLVAETLWKVGSFSITNSFLATWLVMAILILLAILVNKNIRMIPGNIQLIAEMMIGGLYDLFESVVGKHVKMLFPLLASTFIFIVVSNWVGLLPGFSTIGYFRKAEVSNHAVVETEKPVEETHEGTQAGVVIEETKEAETKFVPLLRAATADLNMTLALAVVAVLAIQYYGFKTVGPHYSRRFIDFRNPIFFFVGLLEIISDVSKIVSFAFRLFGNIFAGEVLLAVIAFLIPFIVPLPFLALELFVGFIQALVFSMLTAVFISVALAHGEEHSEAEVAQH